ncbi:MAG: HAMP domain-containing protein [Bryobacteraceae bacterium]
MKMKLKTRLFLATALAVLSILGLSEWFGYNQTAAFLREHASLMKSQTHHADFVASLQQGQSALLVRLVWLHILHAGLTVLALVLVLNVLCNRIVLSPLDDLLRHINYMGRGTWKAAIPVRRNDEIGQLTGAFNALGEQLTATVQQFAAASKLSALALLGQTLVKKVVLATDILRATERQLRDEPAGSDAISAPALASLRVAVGTLEEIPARFEAEFDRELGLHSAASVPKPQQRQRDRLPV